MKTYGEVLYPLADTHFFDPQPLGHWHNLKNQLENTMKEGGVSLTESIGRCVKSTENIRPLINSTIIKTNLMNRGCQWTWPRKYVSYLSSQSAFTLHIDMTARGFIIYQFLRATFHVNNHMFVSYVGPWIFILIVLFSCSRFFHQGHKTFPDNKFNVK